MIWQALDGTCLKGQWQVDADHVCHYHDGSVLGHCLIYRSDGNEIIGRSTHGLDFTLRQGSAAEVTCPIDEPLLSRIVLDAALLPATERAAP